MTVVAQNPAEMGRVGYDRLFGASRGPADPRDIELATRLIVRGSGETPPGSDLTARAQRRFGSPGAPWARRGPGRAGLGQPLPDVLP